MPLTSGSKLGPYEIVGPVGAGGMGEVFRARDAKLGRDVAIKVLPAAFAQDPERVGRFRREAQILASLNHPNIAGIHGLEEGPTEASAESVVALVLEFVDGEDLAQRLKRGPIPLDEAVLIAKQIAQALEEAHERGIVHRDLKPANVKVTPDGKVKVLDFGLAKAMEGEGSTSSSSDLTHSPTMTRAATEAGIVLGTAAYMSPEQARGKKVDKRSDIWAFGVVLYEMLTGKRLFTGETASDILAAVLTRDPDWGTLPAHTPLRIRELLRRCLERNPKQRVHDIADARLELEAPFTASSSGALAVSAPRRSRGFAMGIAGMVFAAGLLTGQAFLSQRPETPAILSRLSIVAPPGGSLFPDPTGVAISPDGTMVAFVVGDATRSESQIWVRSLDTMIARRLEGADGGNLPFWSPDSHRLAFFTNSKLKVVAASGGRAEVLCDAMNGRGGTWNPSNVIVFAPNWSGPLVRISGGGGTPEPVTTLDTGRREYGHRFPVFLPDGEHFLYAALPGREGKFDVFVGSLSGGSPTLVGSMEGAPVYAPPGFLVHMRQGHLAAQPFDTRTLKLTGEAVSLEDEPSSILDPAFSYTAGTSASVSATGTLTYFTTPSTNTRAVWVDAAGRVTSSLNLPAGHYDTVRISPDGSRAIFVRSNSPAESSLWMVDLASGGASPLSSGRGRNDVPAWSPDGTRVAFSSDREGAQEIYVKSVLDASPEMALYRNGKPFKNITAWSPDGQWLALTQLDPESQQNVWLLPASGKGDLVSLVHSAGRDNSGWFSPDGHWLSHASDDTGRFEIYIQSVSGPSRRLQISQGGAILNWWLPNGRGMLFADDKFRSLWRVDLDLGPNPRVSVPRQLANLPPDVTWLDAMPDGQKFIAIIPERAGPGSIAVVQNWRKALGGKP